MTWQKRTRAMADDLAALGVLDPAWREAFEQVPRHVFVPQFYRPDGILVDGADPDMRDEWLDAVYRDDSLITQRLAQPGSGMMVPTSSSTRPSLMALMLGMLDVHDGQTVLEIGTGTGYNAALLAYRLGDDRVTSVDIDPNLVETARSAARGIGLVPYLVAGDGEKGFPARAPFDRVLATCAVPTIPTHWVAQLADDGIIVADLRAATSSTLITLHRTAEGIAEGRFHATPGYFMWLRPRVGDPLRNAQESNFVFDQTGSRQSTTWLDPTGLADPGLGFMIAAYVPDVVQSVTFTDPPAYGLRTGDGSWARVDADSRSVVQTGERSVWNEVETATRRWEQLGRPDPARFRLTVSAEDGQHIWLDDAGCHVPIK
ncbi:MAG: methyltransferase domain-containing protein [Pseudonocardiaceae bacterium]